jgi:TonB-dependent starch-binding outer membrane protein SusC
MYPLRKIVNISIRVFFSTVLVLLAGTFSVFAQDAEIRGRVTDIDRGEPLPGASVLIAGTSTGAATNMDGLYTIPGLTSGTYTIQVRFVGYREMRQEITLGAGEVLELDFRMRPTTIQMDEIIVTGQGAGLERRRLSSPVQSITARDLVGTPVTSIDELVQGRVPGLVSFTTSGQPGTAGRMRSRGITSAFASQTPVIYVDGVRIDNQDNFRLGNDTGGLMNSALADIIVNNVERVEVIKGGAASTLYGSDASAGVIQIFTRKGIQGAPRWTFGTMHGFDLPDEKFVIEDITKDKILRTGYSQQYNFNVTGGSDAATYNLSARIQDAEGHVRKNNSRYYNMSGGFRTTVRENIGVEFSASYTNALYGGMYNNNAIASPLAAAEKGDFNITDNPDSLLEIAFSPDITDAVNRFTTSISGRYSPTEFFSTRLTAGLDYRKNEQRRFNPIESQHWTSDPLGSLRRADREYLTISLDYSVSLTPRDYGALSSTFTLGVQGFREEDRQSFAEGDEFSVPGTDDLSNASIISAGESNQQLFSGGFYGLVNIGLFDRLFLDMGLRVDGNSAFGQDVGLQSYPRAGIAYNIADENFWPFSNEVWGDLKLRASWGQTGKFPPAFTRDRVYGSVSYLDIGGIIFDSPGDDLLKPEKTTTLEFGFDAGFVQDRIGLEVTYFEEVTKDALFAVAQSPTTGFFSQLQNVGEISNKGLELAINALPVTTPNFEWNLRASLASLSNKVTSLGDTPPFNIGGFAFLPMRIEEGHPVGVFRINFIVYDEDGNPTGESEMFRIDHGRSPIPDYTGSLSSTFTVMRNLRLNFLADYSIGGWVLDTGAVLRYFNWQSGQFGIPDDDHSVRVPDGYNFETASEVWVEEANWLKIREISARYNVPSRFIRSFGAHSLAVQFSIRNVFTFSSTDYFDPELHGLRAGIDLDVGGIVFNTLSPPRETRLGIELTF